MAESQAYDEWLFEVDTALVAECGLGVCDLPDSLDLYGLYDLVVEPTMAAMVALRSSGILGFTGLGWYTIDVYVPNGMVLDHTEERGLNPARKWASAAMLYESHRANGEYEVRVTIRNPCGAYVLVETN